MNLLKLTVPMASAATLALLLSHSASAYTTASITVTQNSTPTTRGQPLSIRFNTFSEIIYYDPTSTANSIAASFAAKFSSDFLQRGLCASAKGGLITFKLKSGNFGAIAIEGSLNSPFTLATVGFPTGGAPLPSTANPGGSYTGGAAIAIPFNGSASTDPAARRSPLLWSSMTEPPAPALARTSATDPSWLSPRQLTRVAIHRPWVPHRVPSSSAPRPVIAPD